MFSHASLGQHSGVGRLYGGLGFNKPNTTSLLTKTSTHSVSDTPILITPLSMKKKVVKKRQLSGKKTDAVSKRKKTETVKKKNNKTTVKKTVKKVVGKKKDRF